MIKNYFTIAWRNLLKTKVYSSINLIGLAMGMAVAMLIGLWIWDELSFDHYHQNHARLGRVVDTRFSNGEAVTEWSIDVPLADELRTNYADDFMHVALATSFDNQILAAGDKKITSRGVWVQPELPEMLTLKMLEGSRNALKDPSSILLTASLARTLFSNADPLNKTVRVDNQWEVKVAGVFEDLPYNTLFYRSAFFLSWEKYVNTHSWVKNSLTQWGNGFGLLYVQLNDNTDFDKATARIKNIPGEHLKLGKEELLLHPMDKWHLYNEFRNGKAAGGRIAFVWLFGIIGILVLLLACINFMNLSTARSEKRAKEVGIRKAIGSLRRQLIEQFLSESLLMAFLALILAIILVQLSLPFFSGLASKQLSIPWGQPLFWCIILVFTVFTGLVSGSYPAFYLSAFEPIKVLKGSFRAGRFASLPRRVLVVVQFTVSITLIIGIIIVFRQIQFAKDRPVGYTREGLISVNLLNAPALKAHFEAIRSDLIGTGAVENAAESAGPETNIWVSTTGFDWKGKDPNANPFFGTIAITHDFGKTIGWKIIEGRDFSRNFSTDSGAFILNESAVKLAGFKHPVGQTMTWQGHDHIITGVVKDMVMESPYQPTVPTIFYIDYSWANYIAIRIQRGLSLPDALARIERVFKKYNQIGRAHV